jgi:hypothetical protein
LWLDIDFLTPSPLATTLWINWLSYHQISIQYVFRLKHYESLFWQNNKLHLFNHEIMKKDMRAWCHQIIKNLSRLFLELDLVFQSCPKLEGDLTQNIWIMVTQTKYMIVISHLIKLLAQIRNPRKPIFEIKTYQSEVWKHLAWGWWLTVVIKIKLIITFNLVVYIFEPAWIYFAPQSIQWKKAGLMEALWKLNWDNKSKLQS